MKKILLLFSLLGSLFLASCADLDIPPKNVITDENLLTNDAGMKIYLARLYSMMPFEEFKYCPKWGLRYSGWLNAQGTDGTGEALDRNDLCRAFTGEDTPYWNDGYAKPFVSLHDANYLIENLPKYADNFAADDYNHYLGEAYYVRATVFYAMARRFGGIPLVTKTIAYPGDSDQLEVPRSSEKDTWDQVLADYDKAVEMMKPESPIRGYSNKYVALAFKSQAMLYAGCVAKYNQTVTGHLTGFGAKLPGVRIIGFADSEWQAASIKYFTEAYKAARQVITEGGYELYKVKWSAGDPEAQYQNMVAMSTDLDSKENIYIREYDATNSHGYDSYCVPYIFYSVLASGCCPTLDFVELFEGFDRYPDGTVKVTSGTSNTDGDYLMFDKPQDFFANAEPRLRAYVIFPGDKFRQRDIEIRAGIYTGGTPAAVQPLFSDYSYSSATDYYQNQPSFTGSPKTLYLSAMKGSENEVEYPAGSGQMMPAAAANGPFYNAPEACLTGIYVRKWLTDDPSLIGNEYNSTQHFILMRYAEVLLNAAEAAVELSLAGQPSPDGSDMLQVATDAVNAIRERAGATQLAVNITSDDAGRNIVRKERRKELAFEGKSRWDLRRWRVQHYEGRDGFWGETKDKDMYSSDANYRFRGLYPFFSTQTGKYFFDARFQWVAQKTFGYNIVDYYFKIPQGEVDKSPVIDQQPNR